MRTAAGVFDVSHMGEIGTRGPQAPRTSSSGSSRTTSTQIAERGAQYSVLCREDGGVLDDLFTYRLGRGPVPDGHQRRRTTRRTWPGSATRRPASTSRSRTPTSAGRCSPSRVPRRARRWSGSPTASCRRACAPRTLTVAGVDCLVCGTGYTGEDGVEILVPPDGAGAVWDALLERA